MDPEFILDVENAVSAYEEANHHFATRTREMIRTYGHVETLSRLVVTPDLQQGFEVLRDTNQLDKTFEAVILRHKALFDSEIIQAAKWRLEHPYNLL